MLDILPPLGYHAHVSGKGVGSPPVMSTVDVGRTQRGGD